VRFPRVFFLQLCCAALIACIDSKNDTGRVPLACSRFVEAVVKRGGVVFFLKAVCRSPIIAFSLILEEMDFKTAQKIISEFLRLLPRLKSSSNCNERILSLLDAVPKSLASVMYYFPGLLTLPDESLSALVAWNCRTGTLLTIAVPEWLRLWSSELTTSPNNVDISRSVILLLLMACGHAKESKEKHKKPMPLEEHEILSLLYNGVKRMLECKTLRVAAKIVAEEITRAFCSELLHFNFDDDFTPEVQLYRGFLQSCNSKNELISESCHQDSTTTLASISDEGVEKSNTVTQCHDFAPRSLGFRR
jgi:hypothetical protein